MPKVLFLEAARLQEGTFASALARSATGYGAAPGKADGWKGPHPDAARLDDRKMSRPVRPAGNGGSDLYGELGSGCGLQAKQHDPGPRGQPCVESQVTEVLVECQKDALFARGTAENVRVRAARCVGPNPGHVMPGRADGFDNIERTILVGQELHRRSYATSNR